jgi:hypothetical protein
MKKALLIFGEKEFLIDVPDKVADAEIKANKIAKATLFKNGGNGTIPTIEGEREWKKLNRIIDDFTYRKGEELFNFNKDDVNVGGIIVSAEDKKRGIDFIYEFEDVS